MDKGRIPLNVFLLLSANSRTVTSSDESSTPSKSANKISLTKTSFASLRLPVLISISEYVLARSPFLRSNPVFVLPKSNPFSSTYAWLLSAVVENKHKSTNEKAKKRRSNFPFPTPSLETRIDLSLERMRRRGGEEEEEEEEGVIIKVVVVGWIDWRGKSRTKIKTTR